MGASYLSVADGLTALGNGCLARPVDDAYDRSTYGDRVADVYDRWYAESTPAGGTAAAVAVQDGSEIECDIVLTLPGRSGS